MIALHFRDSLQNILLQPSMTAREASHTSAPGPFLSPESRSFDESTLTQRTSIDSQLFY